MENHGTEFKNRFKVMEDRAKALKAIWTQDEASYEGPFVQFDRIWSWPKPVQKPHPPILLGGETKHSLRRIMEFCDGWFPRMRNFEDPAQEMARFHAAAEEYGRDPRTLSTSLFGAPAKREFLDACAGSGLDRAIFTIPSEGRDKVMPLLDDLAKLL